MKIIIGAVGRLKKHTSEFMLCEKYLKMLKWHVEIKEIIINKKLPAEDLVKKESEKLLNLIPKNAYIVALDEKGVMFSSIQLAKELVKIKNTSIMFLIGGADGHSQALLERADLVLSLGAMVWPHFLARIMLIEQLYRAQTIIEGHPYHRE